MLLLVIAVHIQSTVHTQVGISDSLVGWYPLVEDALDASGSENHLTVVGAPTWTCASGECWAALDGVDDFFYHPDPSFAAGTELSVSLWLSPLSFGAGGGVGGLRPIISKWLSSGQPDNLNDFIVYLGGSYIAWTSDFNPSVTSGYTHGWNAGDWHHLVVTFSDNLRLYVDGELEEEFVATNPFAVNGDLLFQLGGWLSPPLDEGLPWSNGLTFHGGMKNFGVWTRELESAEVSLLYTGAGCTDPSACNYQLMATSDDGSCITGGCTDQSACNYDASAICDDGSCLPAGSPEGCADSSACNYNAAALCDDGSCVYPPQGLSDCNAGATLCGAGTTFDVSTQQCLPTSPSGINCDAILEEEQVGNRYYRSIDAEEVLEQCSDN